MKDYNQLLDFDIIKDQIKQYVASSLTKERIDRMNRFEDIDLLSLELDRVEEAMKCIDYYGRVPLSGYRDLSPLLKKADIDASLEGKELYQIFSHLECIKNINEYYGNIEFELSSLRELFEGLDINENLYYNIERCILPDGSVDDHASSKLFSIRKEIASLTSRIRNTMEKMAKDYKDQLSIDQVTSRNNRFVLPVKAGYKNQFGGLVHDYSNTGQTVYIEPAAVMELNNQMNDLLLSEQEEIHHILMELTRMVKSFSLHFKYNQEFLGDLDFIFAKAMYGVEYHCVKPMITSSFECLYLSEARHPLIDRKKVVSNTIRLDSQKILLISGSNTGGKSVLLKMIGLLSLMSLSGMVIPVNEAIIPFFDDLLVDIGDEQSIEQSLSTFSSHMSRISSILKKATSGSLVILDEVGSGTDPDEGASLAQAILDQLLGIHCFTISSTHYGQLKSYALANEEIAIGSVSFDQETLTPTYHLRMNQSGSSYALEIASQMGFDDELITHARRIKEDHMSEAQLLMESLNKEKEELALREEEINQLLNENRKLNEKYNRQLEKIDKQKERILKEAHEKANDIIKETSELVDEIARELKENNVKDHQITNARKDLKSLQYEEPAVVRKQDHVLKKGDHVLVIKMNREGDIIDLLKKERVKVDVGGMTVTLHQDDVQYLHPKTPIKSVSASTRSVKTAHQGSYELNVIGMRYVEAMERVDKFLDDALVAGYPHVRIVHGMGTGTLRKGVHKMLDQNKNVVSYRDGGPNEGGMGATLVYFSDEKGNKG